MIWYDDLFVGESISSRKKEKIIRGVKKRSMFHSAYLLTLSSNPDNLIDIISTKVLRQRYYPKKGLYVIGIAGDYEEAMMLAGMIVSGVYAVQGDFELRRFIRKNRHNSREDGLRCWESC